MKKRTTLSGTPGDPTIVFSPLEIDGRSYQLVWDFGAIARAEKETGCNLMHGIMAALGEDGMNATEFRGLFYAALGKAHPKVTPAMVDAMIRPDTIPAILAAVVHAWNESVPKWKRGSPTKAGAAAEN